MHNVAKIDDQTNHYLDSLILKMICLQSCKDWNAIGSTKISGSVMSETLFQICDILDLVDNSIVFGRPDLLNEGVHITNEWEEVDDDSGSEKYYDPLMDIYYRPSVDSLGNPLSVKIEFEPAPIFTPNEQRHVHYALEFIQEFLTFLASGTVDWPKIRAFDRLRTFSRGFETSLTRKNNKVSPKKSKPHHRGVTPDLEGLWKPAQDAIALWQQHLDEIQLLIDEANTNLAEALWNRTHDSLNSVKFEASSKNIEEFRLSAEDLIAYHTEGED
jgi:hypothetical protein